MKRVLLAFSTTALAAGVLVTAAAALRFSDASYDVPQGVVGTPYRHVFGAPPPGTSGAGCDPPYFFSVDSGSVPPGLSLDSRSGVLSGTPTQAGTWSFWVSIRDDPSDKPWCNPLSAERQFSATILPRLTIGPETAPAATVGVGYSLPMTATLSDPKTWSVSTGTLPPGLTLDPTSGLISGTPTTAGSYSFAVGAVVDAKRSDTKALTIAVRDPVSITGAAPFGVDHLARSEVGVVFRGKLAASGGSGTYSWSLSAGALPPGVALASDGSITGTPTAAGSYRFTSSAVDSEGRAAQYTGTVAVASELAVAARPLPASTVEKPYRARLAATGGVGTKRWRVAAGRLPRGLHLDRTRGLLTGTPRSAGRYTFQVEVTDSLGARAARGLVLRVGT